MTDEAILAPYSTENPWLQQLFAAPEYGEISPKAIEALRSVSPDQDEQLVAAIECMNGPMRIGWLLATTTCLRWVRRRPTRAQDAWDYGWKVSASSMGPGGILHVGDLIFQCAGMFSAKSAKRFAESHRAMQQALIWESTNTDARVVAALTEPPSTGASLAEEIRQLADLHQQGILSDEEFSAAKSKLVGSPEPRAATKPRAAAKPRAATTPQKPAESRRAQRPAPPAPSAPVEIHCPSCNSLDVLEYNSGSFVCNSCDADFQL